MRVPDTREGSTLGDRRLTALLALHESRVASSAAPRYRVLAARDAE